ncbi:MAG: elongation factor P [Malacoplasma sp.]
MGQIIHAKDLRSGHTFIYKNNLYLVLDNSFNKTAMREGIVKCKVKNLRTQSITVEVLTGEKLEQALVEKVTAVFSYKEKNCYIFMDMTTYDSIEILESKINWEKNFLIEGSEVSILKYENEILSIQLPDQVVLQIIFAENAVQGNTVQTAMKKATLVTNFQIEVPQFIKTDDKVIVKTIDGSYVGREK